MSSFAAISYDFPHSLVRHLQPRKNSSRILLRAPDKHHPNIPGCQKLPIPLCNLVQKARSACVALPFLANFKMQKGLLHSRVRHLAQRTLVAKSEQVQPTTDVYKKNSEATLIYVTFVLPLLARYHLRINNVKVGLALMTTCILSAALCRLAMLVKAVAAQSLVPLLSMTDGHPG